MGPQGKPGPKGEAGPKGRWLARGLCGREREEGRWQSMMCWKACSEHQEAQTTGTGKARPAAALPPQPHLGSTSLLPSRQ